MEIPLDLFDQFRNFTVGVRRLTEKLSVGNGSIAALVEGRHVEGDELLFAPA
jgi:hypothetical protein